MRFIYTKTFAIFSLCLVIISIFVVLQVKGWIGPIKNAVLQSPRPVVYVVKHVTLPVKNFFTTLYQLRKITKENVALSSKVIKLQQDLVGYEQEKKENEALRNELGFARSNEMSLISCSVLAQNSFEISDAVVLNCGTEHGVIEGQAVISQGHLIGKVIYANRNTSTVLLVTSSRFSTDARLSKISTDAVVRGSFGSGLILDQLSQNIPVEKGWLVVTAGINEKIPKNIIIGEVGDVVSTPNDLFKKTTLLSPIDFNNLEFVFVVK